MKTYLSKSKRTSKKKKYAKKNILVLISFT